ncbi:MAG: efflux RND transporter periplasmic adaptor subunit [Bacteroidetes bacterium]|nr:efflux RND transporter periplasmic adaptor subunit [Bacteroidota bacterium]
MKKQTKLLLLLGILVLVAIAYFYPRWSGQQETAPSGAGAGAGGPMDPLPVTVIKLKKEPLSNQLQVSGTVLPNESVEIKPEISGLVTKINFKEGQVVSKGTPLVYLNDNELQAQFQRLQYTQKLFQTQESRQKQLLAREAISQEEYDIVLNQYNTAISDINLVEAQLEKTVIRAPFTGRLGLRQISEGSVINPSNVIVSIVNSDPIKLEFSIPERYASLVSIGSSIFFSSESSKEEVEGKVYAFEPQIDAATRTLKLRAQSPNKSGKYLPGMFVKIRFVLDIEEEALLVPAEAVIPELSGYKVFVVGADGTAEQRIIEIGTRTDTQVQVISGLNEGDLVLTSGVMQVRQGMPIKATPIN